MGISSPLYVWQNAPMKPSSTGLFLLLEIFLIIIVNSLSQLVMGLFRLSFFFSDSVLNGCVFLTNLSISYRLSNCWHTIIHSLFNDLLHFCDNGHYLSSHSLSFLFGSFVFTFFVDEPGWRLITFVCFVLFCLNVWMSLNFSTVF